MPGTIIGTLSSTSQADNTVATAANSGFSSVAILANTNLVHLAAAKMAESEGYRFTQTSTNTVVGYSDFTAQNQLSFRLPFRFSATPTAQVVFLRGFSGSDHATNLWSLALTTSNRLNFVETASGGLNVSSPTGSPLQANTDYVILGKVDVSGGGLNLAVYPRGNSTALCTVSGALVSTSPTGSLRLGIATASSLAQMDTNDKYAWGSGDYLARTDLVVSALAITLSLSPSTGTVPYTMTATVTPTGGTGNAISYSIDWGDGTTAGPQSSATFTKTVSTAGSRTATANAVQS